MVSAYRAHPTCQRFSGQDRHGREGRQFQGVGRRVDNQSRLTSPCVLVVWLVTGRSDAVTRNQFEANVAHNMFKSLLALQNHNAFCFKCY